MLTQVSYLSEVIQIGETSQGQYCTNLNTLLLFSTNQVQQPKDNQIQDQNAYNPALHQQMLKIIIYVLDISQLRYHEHEILQGKKKEKCSKFKL